MQRFLVFLSLLLALTPGSFAQDQAAPDADSLEAMADAFVKPFQEMGVFSGAILLARGDKILLQKGYGMANYELESPNRPDTKFQIASLSKSFTATAILLLEEQGKLRVTDPLNRYLPDYPNGDHITIHHLLTHTSGIPNVNVFPEYEEKSKLPHTLGSILQLFRDKPLLFKPGEKYSYSNSNYNLLAYIIEKASGQSYGEFLHSSILNPLKMKNTGHWRAEALLKQRASGYVPAGLRSVDNAPYVDWSIKTGNGSLYSTVEDLYKWDRALYHEGVLKKATLEKMFREKYGWFGGKRFNRNVIRYNGRSPGYGAEIQRYVDDQVCIIVLSNNYAGAATMVADGLAAIVLREPYETPRWGPAARIDPSVLLGYAGRYQFGSDFFVPGLTYTVQAYPDHLVMRTGETAVPLVPLSEIRFFDRIFLAEISFVKSEQGEVTHLIWHEGRDFQAKKLKEAPGASE